MDALRIQGGATLTGSLPVSGSKNASLPLMTAALLAPGRSVLRGTPDLADVKTLGSVLNVLGVQVVRDGDHLSLDATDVNSVEAPYDLVRTMRASILVLGPLLARFGRARVSLPGGCAIGARPIDQHLKGFERLGATIVLEHGYVEATCKKLKGAEVIFDMPTVGGTENLMLAASLAEGTTVLRNAAREPEIADLADTLSAMGAQIEGAGTQTITIQGQTSLEPYDHRVIPDRIEFGTFVVAGALCGKNLNIVGGMPAHQAALLDKLAECGTPIDANDERVIVSRGDVIKPLDIKTAPYPGFPTDMQAQVMTLATLASGTSTFHEAIFENRFMHVPELVRLGANIRVEGGKAIVRGVNRLSASTVMATDLRASASLVLAALVAEGETTIRRIYHLDRGYERIGQKLAAVGAKVDRYAE